jgi:hypothetical protein
MHGGAHIQYKHNLKVIGVGHKYAWQNTATSYISKERFATAAEAQAAIDKQVGEGTGVYADAE